MRSVLHPPVEPLPMDEKQPERTHRRVARERVDEEIGATAGKTHEEVLDQVVGRERRLRNETTGGGAQPGDET